MEFIILIPMMCLVLLLFSPHDVSWVAVIPHPHSISWVAIILTPIMSRMLLVSSPHDVAWRFIVLTPTMSLELRLLVLLALVAHVMDSAAPLPLGYTCS